MNKNELFPPETHKSAATVQTLARALSVIEAIAEANNPGVTEVAARVGLNRTTAHRLVQTLKALGYVQASPDGRGLQVGLKVLPLAARQLDSNAVRLAALPHLHRLAQESGERTNLGVLFEGSVLYLAGVEKPSLPNMYSRFGKLAPVHSCSLGKAMLAFRPEHEARALLAAHPLTPQTDRTLDTLDALLADFSATRDRGFAVDDGEHLPGITCLAAPVLDAQAFPVAAISVSGSNREAILAHASRVREAAEIISHVLA